MGRVVTNLKLTNKTDLDKFRAGEIAETEVRTVEIEALVDTGASQLVLPEDVVRRLGVPYEGTKPAKDARGFVVEVPWVGGLFIEILGRAMTCDALVVPVGATPLIGQIPLEGCDLVVDPRSREVRPNPAHPDMPIFDLMAVGM
jgi:clan AA aspartic protease